VFGNTNEAHSHAWRTHSQQKAYTARRRKDVVDDSITVPGSLCRRRVVFHRPSSKTRSALLGIDIRSMEVSFKRAIWTGKSSFLTEELGCIGGSRVFVNDLSVRLNKHSIRLVSWRFTMKKRVVSHCVLYRGVGKQRASGTMPGLGCRGCAQRTVCSRCQILGQVAPAVPSPRCRGIAGSSDTKDE
jgi:hypothetical protein